MSDLLNSPASQSQSNQLNSSDTDSVTLEIEGMTCASCVNRIERKLKKTPGVQEANVNLATEKGTVKFDPTLVQIASLVKAVESSGYKASPLEVESKQKEAPRPTTLPAPVSIPVSAALAPVQEPVKNRVELEIEGMTCASCVNRIERKLKKVGGVQEANVNLATERGNVTYAPEKVSVPQLITAIEAAGYKARPYSDEIVVNSNKEENKPQAVVHETETKNIASSEKISFRLLLPMEPMVR